MRLLRQTRSLWLTLFLYTYKLHRDERSAYQKSEVHPGRSTGYQALPPLHRSGRDAFRSVDELRRRIEGELVSHIGNIEQSDDITFMSLRKVT